MKRNLTPIILVICFIALQVYAKEDSRKEFQKTCNRLIGQKQFDRLISSSREYMLKNPGYAPAYRFFILGNLYGKRQTKEIEKFLKGLLEKKPKDACVHYALGYLYYLQGKLDISEKQLRQSISLNPNISLGQHNLGVLLSKLGKIDDALVHIKKALKLEPGLELAKKNLAIVLKKKNRPVAAKSIEQLAKLIWYEMPNNDSPRLRQIKRLNIALIRENKYLTLQWCNTLLNKAIEMELSGHGQKGDDFFQASQTLAKMYKIATDSKYLLDKLAAFRKWNKEKKEKYLEMTFVPGKLF